MTASMMADDAGVDAKVEGVRVPNGSRGRPPLTAVQSLFVAVSVTAASFLAAMSWGMQRLELLFTALILVAILGAMLAARRRRIRVVRTVAVVTAVSPPPVGRIVGRCALRLRVDPTGRPFQARVVEQRLPLTQWPKAGATVPVEVPRTGPRRVRVLWELVRGDVVRKDVAAATVAPSRPPRAQPVPAPRQPSIYTDYAPWVDRPSGTGMGSPQDAAANPEDIGPGEGEHGADDG